MLGHLLFESQGRTETASFAIGANDTVMISRATPSRSPY